MLTAKSLPRHGMWPLESPNDLCQTEAASADLSLVGFVGSLVAETSAAETAVLADLNVRLKPAG